MPALVDCHCHMTAEDFDADIAEVIEKAKKAGLVALVSVAEHHGEFARILELSERFPGFVLPCLGVHPVQGSPCQPRSATLEDLMSAQPVIEQQCERLMAVGEVGLDFSPRVAKTEQDKQGQREVLSRQVALALRLDLPLNVHSRSAGRPTIQLLKEQGAQNVLLHAFDGRPSVAMEGVQAGYFFSIPPSIVRSEQKEKLVKQLPLEYLVLETDSPALGPVKQTRNEPSNIVVSCEYVARVKGVSVEHVAQCQDPQTRKKAATRCPSCYRPINECLHVGGNRSTQRKPTRVRGKRSIPYR